MSSSIKKLFGTVCLVALLVLYALLATAIASAQLATSPWWVHLIYFFVTGLIIWLVPAMFIIRWMIKLPSEDY